MLRRGDRKKRLVAAQCVLCQRSAHHGGRDGRKRIQRVAAQDQLIAIERAGQWRVERRGNGGRRACRDEYPPVRAAQTEISADHRE
jgi:hypothetical protein